MQGFEQFLLRGNVVVMALGIVIGSAFATVFTIKLSADNSGCWSIVVPHSLRTFYTVDWGRHVLWM